MAAERRRRFHWLAPGTLNTLKVKAVSGLNQSEFAEIDVKTSGFVGMTWQSGDKIVARPVYWNRTIVVTWSLINEPLRMDYYRLFRKEDTTSDASNPPTTAEKADYAATGAAEDYFVKDTGRWNRHVDHLQTEDPDIDEEKYYWYWVWAFDKGGLQSADYLGGSGPGTDPDNAQFGKPDDPEIYPDAKDTEIEYHDTIKWLCNFNLVFRGVAEGFWAQAKMSSRALWGAPIWIDYDSSNRNYQLAEFQNLIAGRNYDFRVRAVNVPVVLVSNWVEENNKNIPYENVKPDEIEGTSGKRINRSGLRKGEFIRVVWKRPTLAILEQQIEYYEVFREVGTDANASTYMATITADTATPYDEMTRFEGTRFIDDEVHPLPGAPAEMTWNGEGATEALRRTADFDGLALEGTLNGGVAINTNNPNNGSYSLEISAAGDYLQIPNGGDGWFDANEGYVTFYVDLGNLPPGTQSYFRIYADADNFLELYHFSARLYFRYRANGNTVETNVLAATWLGFAKIELRWKVSTDTFEVRWNEGSWASGSGMDTFAGASSAVLQLGSPVDFLDTYHIDDWSITDSYDSYSQSYYHYWIRAVDIAGLKSDVSSTAEKSYTKVEFTPPDAPANLDIEQNVVQILLWKMQTMKFTWDSVPEAVWYRVKLRLKGPGRPNFGPWFYTAKLPEETIDDTDDDNPGGSPKYVYPFPVFKDTTAQWAVSAENMGGKNWSATREDVISADDSGPGKILNFTGNCHGFKFFGLKFWIGYTLKWDDRPWYEGIASYEVQWYNLSSTWETVGFRNPTIIPGKKVVFNGFALPVAGSHKFRVIITDGDDNTETSSTLELPWSGFWSSER